MDASGSDPGVESSDSGRDQSVSRLRESYGRLAGCVLVSSGVRSVFRKIRLSRKAGHPSHMHLGIPPALKQAIDKNARLSSSERFACMNT